MGESLLAVRTGCHQSCLAMRLELMNHKDCEDPTAAELQSNRRFVDLVSKFDELEIFNFGNINRTLLTQRGCDVLSNDLDVEKVFGKTGRHIVCGYDPVRSQK